MRYKSNYWRKPASPIKGGTDAVRFVICKKCGKAVGGPVIGFDTDAVAGEMRNVARQHREATGHKAFFFADGIRRTRRRSDVPELREGSSGKKAN